MSLPQNLPITNGWTYGFMSFPRALEWSETQTDSSRIWTLFPNSISYDNKYYAKCASYNTLKYVVHVKMGKEDCQWSGIISSTIDRRGLLCIIDKYLN